MLIISDISLATPLAILTWNWRHFPHYRAPARQHHKAIFQYYELYDDFMNACRFMFYSKHWYRVEFYWRFDIRNKQLLDALIGVLYTPDLCRHTSCQGCTNPM